MSLKTKILIGEKPYEAHAVEVEEATKPWADFILSDGSRLRVNVIIDAVHRLEGEYDARGNPLYYVNSRTVSSTASPEELRKAVA